MRLIKNDPNYNEQWPRPWFRTSASTASTSRNVCRRWRNDGKLSPHLPEGTPFGLVGTSSLYKRESYPNGVVPPGSVTATWAGKGDSRDGYNGWIPFNTSENGASLTGSTRAATPASTATTTSTPSASWRWSRPPTATAVQSRAASSAATPTNVCVSSARSRCASLAATRRESARPLDPDGNPDTSFLAKIPADTAFTFQTLDKNGMVLNMAQTWHQLRPGEIRNDCGGCHAHSQKPTLFKDTAAARADYKVFDLTRQTPLLTTKSKDESGKKWDARRRDRPALREGRQERRVFPRCQADPRPQLCRLPYSKSRTNRPAIWSSTTTR